MSEIYNGDFCENRKIDSLIEQLLCSKPENELCVIGIDGMCGSGKTSLAEYIAESFGAAVIHMDDFFLPMELRTEERLAMPGGNVHYERFIEEVGEAIRRGKRELEYRRFDCSVMDYEPEPVRIGTERIYVVEGSYAFRPELEALYDLKLFLGCSPELQRERIIKRCGAERFEMFRTRWIPMEEKYFQELGVKQRADHIVITG